MARGEFFELLNLSRIEDDSAELVAAREYVQLTFELPAVLQHDEHDPVVLGKHCQVGHEPGR
jgi:hypothetical protein